jgi:hypothetical protein
VPNGDRSARALAGISVMAKLKGYSGRFDSRAGPSLRELPVGFCLLSAQTCCFCLFSSRPLCRAQRNDVRVSAANLPERAVARSQALVNRSPATRVDRMLMAMRVRLHIFRLIARQWLMCREI